MKSLKEQITAYCTDKGISQNEFASQAGINPAFVSNIMNEKSVSEFTENKLRAFIGGKGFGQIVETSDFDMVQNMCETAKKNRLLCALIGNTGTGKTTALRAYARKRNIFFVTCYKTMNAKQLFVTLLREMGVNFDGSINNVMDKICERLNSLKNPLVIIDEASKFNHTQILYLQVLRDRTEASAGLILSGMPYFKSKLIEGARKDKEGYAEFFRRVQIWSEMDGILPNERKQVFEALGIEATPALRNVKEFGYINNQLLIQKVIKGEI